MVADLVLQLQERLQVNGFSPGGLDGIMGPKTYSAAIRAQRAPTPADVQLPWLELAYEELRAGVSELPGDQHNARILAYHRATTLAATTDEVPWCASFACWCLETAGIESPRSAAARAFTRWGRRLEAPQPGAIVVLSRGKPWQGHVGFYVYHDTEHVFLLGGNQGNCVSVAPYAVSRLVNYCWPLQEVA